MDVPDHVNEGIEAISGLHVRAERGMTSHQRGVERLTGALGRPAFLYALVFVIVVWVASNLLLPSLGSRAFDPPPFALLQWLASLSALLISTVVLITQNRQLKLMERRGHLDMEIGLLSEGKIAKVIALLEELRRDMPDVKNRHDPEAEAMETRTDPHAVADALEATIDAKTKSEP